MKEPRKIVLVLGNGFDLDLGLKTSYKDFWESEYCPKDFPAPLIRHLNTKLDGHSQEVRWFDLENELLQYALRGDKSDIVNEQELQYIATHDDSQLTTEVVYFGSNPIFNTLVNKSIIRVRRGKLGLQSADIPNREALSLDAHARDAMAFQHIKDGLKRFIHSLSYDSLRTNSVAQSVLLAVKNAHDKGDSVDIFTFNYTPSRTISRLFDEDLIHYVHGDYMHNIIIGTRDELSLDSNYDFVQKSFDTHYMSSNIYEKMENSDELIIFGHSLGDSDRQYFSSFFRRLASSNATIEKTITFFTEKETSKTETKRALQTMTDGALLDFSNRTNLQMFKTKDLTPDQHEFKTFLTRFLDNEILVENLIGKLIKESPSN